MFRVSVLSMPTPINGHGCNTSRIQPNDTADVGMTVTLSDPLNIPDEQIADVVAWRWLEAELREARNARSLGTVEVTATEPAVGILIEPLVALSSGTPGMEPIGQGNEKWTIEFLSPALAFKYSDSLGEEQRLYMKSDYESLKAVLANEKQFELYAEGIQRTVMRHHAGVQESLEERMDRALGCLRTLSQLPPFPRSPASWYSDAFRFLARANDICTRHYNI